MNGLSLKEIKNEIQLLDPAFSQAADNDPELQTAVVLLAAAFSIGPNTECLVAFTSYAESFIAAISQRMRQHGLWTDAGVVAEHWFEGDDWIPAAFWSDCLVADGSMTVRRRENGDLEYRALKPV